MKKENTNRIAAIEQAVVLLAQHIERCPFCEYKVAEEVLELMGYERLPAPQQT